MPRRDEPSALESRPASELTLTELIAGVWWTNYAESRLASRTRRNYSDSYRRWVSRDPLGETPISLITTETITTWQDRCRARGATAAAITQAQ